MALCTRIGMLINHIKNEEEKKLKRYKQRMINFYSCCPKTGFLDDEKKTETFSLSRYFFLFNCEKELSTELR